MVVAFGWFSVGLFGQPLCTSVSTTVRLVAICGQQETSNGCLLCPSVLNACIMDY